MGKWIHRISNVNIKTKTADCANCGRVNVYLKRKSWICLPGKRASVNRAKAKRVYGKLADSRPSNCEVCGAKGYICYDHDHATGKFRGWLCYRCNLALGYVYDNPDTLRKLADYLERNNNVISDSDEGNVGSS